MTAPKALHRADVSMLLHPLAGLVATDPAGRPLLRKPDSGTAMTTTMSGRRWARVAPGQRVRTVED